MANGKWREEGGGGVEIESDTTGGRAGWVGRWQGVNLRAPSGKETRMFQFARVNYFKLLTLQCVGVSRATVVFYSTILGVTQIPFVYYFSA